MDHWNGNTLIHKIKQVYANINSMQGGVADFQIDPKSMHVKS